MRKFNAKLASAIMAAVLAGSSLTAFATNAEPPKATLTISGSTISVGDQYKLYRLLNVTDVVTNSETGEITYVYEINSTYKDLIKENVNVSVQDPDDHDILDEMGRWSSNAEHVKKFAAAMQKALVSAEADKVVTVSADNTNNGVLTVTGLEDGYYLVVESTEDADSAYSAPMATTIVILEGKTNAITEKSSVPSITKKVQENSLVGSTSHPDGYNDVADYEIGAPINFKLSANIPAGTMDNYDSYLFRMVDSMDKGLEYLDVVSVTFDLNGTLGDDDDVVLTGDAIANKVSITPSSTDDKNHVVFDFADLKAAYTHAHVQNVVVVYQAALTEDAVVGVPGNENEVFLQYSNNPTYSGNGVWNDNDTPDDPTDDYPETPEKGDPENPDDPDNPYEPSEEIPHGETPKDVVVVFTFAIEINKVSNVGEALEDAEFSLYRGTEIDEDNLIATGITAGSNVVIKGLEANAEESEYILVETKAPEGFVLPEDPVVIKLQGEYAQRDSYPVIATQKAALVSLNGSTELIDAVEITNAELEYILNGTDVTVLTPVDGATALNDVAYNVSLNILNTPHGTMPETGGVGTAGFTFAGIAMMAAAALGFKRKED